MFRLTEVKKYTGKKRSAPASISRIVNVCFFQSKVIKNYHKVDKKDVSFWSWAMKNGHNSQKMLVVCVSSPSPPSPRRLDINWGLYEGSAVSLVNICKCFRERNYILRHFFFNYRLQMRCVKSREMYPIETNVKKRAVPKAGQDRESRAACCFWLCSLYYNVKCRTSFKCIFFFFPPQ